MEVFELDNVGDDWSQKCPFCGWVFFDATGELGEEPCEHLVLDIDFDFIDLEFDDDIMGILKPDIVPPEIMAKLKEFCDEVDGIEDPELAVVNLCEEKGYVVHKHTLAGNCGPCCGGGEQILVWKKP